jgi:predicted nuclease with TOPRIM domain
MTVYEEFQAVINEFENIVKSAYLGWFDRYDTPTEGYDYGSNAADIWHDQLNERAEDEIDQWVDQNVNNKEVERLLRKRQLALKGWNDAVRAHWRTETA